MYRFRIVLPVILLTVILLVVLGAGSAHADTIAHWNFEEGSAGTRANGTILDVSGNGQHGSGVGVPYGPIYLSNSLPGSTLGLQFSGWTNNSVFVADNPLFALTGSLTVEAWIRLDNSQRFSLNQVVFRGDSLAGLDPYYLAVNGSNQVVWHIESTATSSKVFSAALEIGRYYHVAGVLDDLTGLQSLYIDGELVSSTTTAVRPLATLNGSWYPGISFGSLQDGSGQWFYGQIDEVRISNMALYGSDASNPVPEPSTIWLCGLAALGMGLYRRRRS